MSLCLSNLKCYPWLETEASAAGCLVGLFTQLTDTLHHKFRGGFPASHHCLCCLHCCSYLYLCVCVYMLQIVFCPVREVHCGCAWCSTVRAAPPPVHPSTFFTCTTHTSAACPGDTCTPTLSWWSSSSMWDILALTPDFWHCILIVTCMTQGSLLIWDLGPWPSGTIISWTSCYFGLKSLFLETSRLSRPTWIYHTEFAWIRIYIKQYVKSNPSDL